MGCRVYDAMANEARGESLSGIEYAKAVNWNASSYDGATQQRPEPYREGWHEPGFDMVYHQRMR